MNPLSAGIGDSREEKLTADDHAAYSAYTSLCMILSQISVSTRPTATERESRPSGAYVLHYYLGFDQFVIRCENPGDSFK